jgi:ubiquinone/menaquinone biosynthesis C-methylase UbiE
MMELRNLPSSQTRNSYNLVAGKYHDLFHDELNGKPFDRSLLDRFAGMLPPGSSVLDAGCGPSAHIGKFLAERGVRVLGLDIAEECVHKASSLNPSSIFIQSDIATLPFRDKSLNGIVAYYSIIHTPKKFLADIFREFHRVMTKSGVVLVAVKAGKGEEELSELLSIPTSIHFSYFEEEEIRQLVVDGGFELTYLHRRKPYNDEIAQDRIYALGTKRA